MLRPIVHDLEHALRGRLTVRLGHCAITGLL